MRAWIVESPGPIASGPLRLVERPVPEPARDEILVRVVCCGVCRTDLHLAEGDLPPRRPGVTPGHQAVGEVVRAGEDVGDLAPGDRVGIAWLRRTCGACRWCRRGAENLCPTPSFTGWDADGGFAEYAVAPAAFTYRLPTDVPAESLAPLLCAGIIGYRALRRAALPPGGRLGLYGFGSSAHLTAQLALAQGAELYVVTRDEGGRRLASELGAVWTGAADARPPVPLDSAIIFAPAGELVPSALEAIGRGGTVAVAGIHLSDVPSLVYDRHLFLEKDLRSVTANTRADGADFLRLAHRLGVSAHVVGYPFEELDGALVDVATGRATGSAVLRVAG
ncbi:zinc-dependent alcohol dehydrogenase family protein [Nocardioides iriomotensis]|uniref:Probable alcohol dehydrogenase AdhA n=1 Tax=Nocardioides iriomotensis TaxID=715784 RepID=A0A4Q5J1L4_9ACTN|nr:zinc-dependent alcohol dehydrogenase family protein [Nocardioides iriomotensis]RYU11508.1 zinc-binding alcohol dehydrogenase family protein [Nocardioides iriomotensis]